MVDTVRTHVQALVDFGAETSLGGYVHLQALAALAALNNSREITEKTTLPVHDVAGNVVNRLVTAHKARVVLDD